MTDPFEDETTDQVKKKPKVIFLILGVVVILIIILTYWYYGRSKTETVIDLSNQASEVTEQDKVADVIAKVSQLMILPEDGEPMVATILDAQALAAEQAFYADASDGDKLLIFPNRAIIYNPTNNIIVNVGEVRVVERLPDDEGTEEETAEKEEEEESVPPEPVVLDIEIRNGSGKSGAAQVLSDELSSELNKITSIGNADNSNYDSTVIVNISGKDVSRLVTQLGITAVQALPEGEEASTADVLIIIGSK